ncbi:MAG: hypothetical protein HDR95_07300 [Bacteroides sp.]|nr:hypothetical protein [Bacteroides sp.]
MKKLIYTLLIAVLATFAASARDTYSHDSSVLPVAARTTLKNNFKADIHHIKIDKTLGHVSEYEVILNDGTEVTFDNKGNWKDIEMNSKTSVPTKFVPESVVSYVKQFHPKAVITGIEKERSGYSVELSNGVDMKFNKDGKFVKYDD